jgi:hypothetical protein
MPLDWITQVQQPAASRQAAQYRKRNIGKRRPCASKTLFRYLNSAFADAA